MTAIKAFRISANCQNCLLAIRFTLPPLRPLPPPRSPACGAPQPPAQNRSHPAPGDRGAVNQPEIEAVDLLARYVAAMVLDAAHLRLVNRAVWGSDPAGRCAWLRGNTGTVFRRHAVHLIAW